MKKQTILAKLNNLVPNDSLCTTSENEYIHLMFSFTNKKVKDVYSSEMECSK